MAIPLREPFFLSGQRNVLVRAIRMSLVLGVISGGAGLAAVLLFMLPGRMLNLDETTRIGCSTAVSLATVVGVPYFRWRGDSARGVATKASCIVLIAAAPMILNSEIFWGLIDFADQQLHAWKNDLGLVEVMSMPGQVRWGMSLLWPAWSAACFRRSWRWLVMLLVSGLSIPLWFLSMAVFLLSVKLLHSWLPWEVSMILEEVAKLFIPGQFFALLVIPWGAPFWWPAETEVSPPGSPA